MIADTVVLTRVEPLSTNISPSLQPEIRPDILEKPMSKADNLRMLFDMNGKSCEVVTGISIGVWSNLWLMASVLTFCSVYPILLAPGYALK